MENTLDNPTANLIKHWESHLENSRKAVEVAERMLEQLYLKDHAQLELGLVAVSQIVDDPAA